jgi:hypothetical protein
VEKVCKICNKTDTTKWYTGPLCRQCYRHQPHVKQKESDSAKKSCAKYRKNNKQRCATLHKEWCKNNSVHIAEYQSNYRLVNKERKRFLERQYLLHPEKRLASQLRNRMRIALKRCSKIGSAVKELGCSIPELKTHLESRFQPGMTWDNHTIDGWHIDNIIPLSSFDLSDPNQFKRACHYTNLQPLWWRDNLAKGDKLE